ncbi:MAG TPA: hypothetical protein VEU33_13415 [Archangium sp.]|nr:hypothetical protein [Archangium sp.]
MAHATDDGLSPLVVPQSSLSEETSGEGQQRPSLPRTPPRVWPPVSPADMGRVVRRLKLTAERLRGEEPLLEGAA